MTEQAPSPQETLAKYVDGLEITARETVALLGLTGLDVQVNPGGGWSSAKLADKVVLTIDPFQITARNRDSQSNTDVDIDELLREITETDQSHIRHTICHELGHIRDFIDPTHEDQPSISKSDHFFWNVLDDATIDRRLRTVPSLDECTDELYGKVLFPTDSYEDQPKHTQLMYGLLVNSVTGASPTLDPQVQAIIDALHQVPSGDSTYDIMQVLASHSTTLQERRLIAEHYIKPHFDALLVEDQQQNPDANNEEQYEQYEQVVHGGGHGSGEEGQSEEAEKEGSASDGDGNGEPSDSGDMHTSTSEAGSMLKELAKEQKQPTKESKPSKKPSDKTIAALGAGSIAAELQLPKADAKEYLASLNVYRAEIMATAKAFETLAVPSRTSTSPRFTNRASYSGHKLHTGRVAQAAIQMETGVEQAIWRPVEHRGKRLDFTLDKLDVHLLVDISTSMGGEKAQQAAITALMLMEGLELARHNLAKNSIRNQKPDVRLQVTAFGSDHEVISPLSYSPDAKYKGQAFTALRNPNAWSTLVSGALGTVKLATTQHPNRNQLVFIISDGGFSDYEEAKKAAQTLPPAKAQIIQLVIGSPGVRTITGNVSHLEDAKSVPLAVRSQLESYMAGLQTI